MDLGSAIVGTIILAICIFPFVILHYRRVRKEKKMLQSLREVARQYSCNISQHEFCGDFALGVDERRGFVFFSKQKEGQIISQFVDLSEVQTCQAVRMTRPEKHNGENGVITERVELGFLPKSKDRQETRFELYEEELNKQLSGELQFVEKWSSQIGDQLKNKT